MDFKKMLSIIMVVVLCLALFSGCGEEENNETSTTTEIANQAPEKTIVLVGGNENDGFFQNLKKGAEDAAKKYSYSLKYLGTDESTDSVVSAHISSIEKAINDSASGFVIVPNGEGYSEIYGKLYDEGISVVQIDNLTEDDFEKLESNKKNPIVSTVSTSYKEAGALVAEKLFEEIKEDIKKSKKTFVVGVLERDDSISDEEKTNGFTEKFSELADADSQIKGKYTIETESGNGFEASLAKFVEDDAKAVFITHSSIADKVSDVVSADAEKYKNIIFCGFDSGAKQLKWLNDENTAKFIGGVAQDSYNLGYNAVEQSVFAIEGKGTKEKIEIAGQWYDKQNIDKLKQEKIVYEK